MICHLPFTTRTSLVAALAVLAGAPLRSGAEDAPDPFAKWEQEIAAIEAKDKESPPPENALLFIGSSSIRLWDLAAAFPGEKTINRGFGGSELADSTHFAPRLVFPHRPRQIILYAGDNDLANGKSAERVAADFADFVIAVRKELPEIPIAYIAIKPSLARWKLWPAIQAANAAIRAHCEGEPALTFIDIATPMLGEDGRPRKDLLVDDGLHLNPQGYAVWNDAVRKALARD